MKYLKIEQKDYGNLEIDVSEKDIIQIYMDANEIAEVVQIERANLKQVIEILQNELKNNS